MATEPVYYLDELLDEYEEDFYLEEIDEEEILDSTEEGVFRLEYPLCDHVLQLFTSEERCKNQATALIRGKYLCGDHGGDYVSYLKYIFEQMREELLNPKPTQHHITFVLPREIAENYAKYVEEVFPLSMK